MFIFHQKNTTKTTGGKRKKRSAVEGCNRKLRLQPRGLMDSAPRNQNFEELESIASYESWAQKWRRADFTLIGLIEDG